MYSLTRRENMHAFKKVLLVEDDNISALIVTRLMAMNNFCEHITVAENGMEAMQALQRVIDSGDVLPGLILLDLRMGIMDGWGFLDWYRIFTEQLDQSPPVYILSSTIDDKDSSRALQYSQVKGFISKPITTEQLAKIAAENNPLND